MPRDGMPATWPTSMAYPVDLTGVALVAALVLLAPPGVQSASADDLVEYEIVNGAIPEPLTNRSGNPARGREIVRDIRNATCLICHQMPISEEPDQGDIGPPLHGVGNRLTPGELRLRIVDSQAINPDTIMPPYYRVEGLYRVGEAYRGRPIYSAQQVEDVVAYLSQLRE